MFGIGAPPMTDSSSDGDGRTNESSETSSGVADNEDLLCLICFMSDSSGHCVG